MEIDRILDLPRADSRVTPPRMCPSDPQITVVIDKESFAEFTVSRHLLISSSSYLAHLFATRPSANGNTAFSDDPVGGIISSPGAHDEKLYLTKLKVCDFHDFIRWANEGRVLPFHFGYDEATIATSASRLVRALEIGIMLDSKGYQMIAMRKLHDIGTYLERPEELVNEIFTVTRQMPNHPARRMIVAIVAAKTMVKGKKAIAESGGKRIEQGERLRSPTFWGMYEEYYREKRGEWGYPQTFEKAILWSGYKQ